MIGIDDEVLVAWEPRQHRAHERMMRHGAIKKLATKYGYQGAEIA